MARIDIDNADVDETTRNLIREIRTELDEVYSEIKNLRIAITESITSHYALQAQQAQIDYVLSGTDYDERWQAIETAIRNLE